MTVFFLGDDAAGEFPDMEFVFFENELGHFLESFVQSVRKFYQIFHPVDFLSESQFLEISRIVFMVVDSDHGAGLVESFHEHSFRVEVRETERPCDDRHAALPAPFCHGVQERFEHFPVLDEIYPSETDVFRIPSFICLAVDDGGDPSGEFPVFVCKEKFGFAEIKSGIGLPVESHRIVRTQVRHITRMFPVQVGRKIYKSSHLLF